MGKIFSGGGIGNVASGGGIPEAPVDGIPYNRKDAAWVQAYEGVPDAPADGKIYGRQDEAWAEIPAGGGDIVVPATWDSPGSIVTVYYKYPSGAETVQAGTIIYGSYLTPGCVSKNIETDIINIEWAGAALAGTWRLHGMLVRGNYAESVVTVQRVDGTPVMPASAMNGLTRSVTSVSNLSYANADNSAINCEVYLNGVWYPFTASPTDSTAYGPVIYQNAVSGLYGDIKPFA